MKLSNLKKIVPLLAISIFSISCNIYGFLDNPSGDEQLLSAARACFDDGDLDCARDLYQKLSNNVADVKNSEEAFEILDRNGASMSVFIQSFGSGSGGSGLTTLSNKLTSQASESTRINIYTAYKKIENISNTSLKGLVRFVTAITLTAELLAEDAVNGIFDANDLASDATTCKAQTTVGCLASASCDIASASHQLAHGASVDLGENTSDFVDLSGTPTLSMLHAAIQEVDYALNTEIGAGGKFSSGTGSFSSDIISTTAPTTAALARCYRRILLSLGVGE